MRFALFSALLVVTSVAAHAQVNVEWVHFERAVYTRGITPEGHVRMLGEGGRVFELDEDGNVVAEQFLPQFRDGVRSGVFLFEDNGDVLIAGSIYTLQGGASYIARIDGEGQTIWEITRDHEGPDAYTVLKRLCNGNLIAVGYYCPGARACSGSNSVHVMMLTPKGKVLWDWVGDGSDTLGNLDDIQHVSETPDGEILLFGRIAGGCSYAATFDAVGQGRGSCITSAPVSILSAVVPTVSDSLLVMSRHTEQDISVHHLTWMDTYGRVIAEGPVLREDGWIRGIAPVIGGGYLVGRSFLHLDGSSDISLRLIREDGSVAWEQFLDWGYSERLTSISPLSTGAFLLIGRAQEITNGSDDSIVAQVTLDTETTVEPNEQVLDNGAPSVYPNPSTGPVTVTLPNVCSEGATVDIFNIRGQRIRSFRVEGQGIGSFTQLIWDGEDDSGRSVSAGVYLVRAAGSGQVETATLMRY